MDNDLDIIDCVEKLRERLVSVNPDFGRKREELLTRSVRLTPQEFVLEAYLAARLKIDMDSGSGRRTVHNILSHLLSSHETSQKRDSRDIAAVSIPGKEQDKLRPGIVLMESLLKDSVLKKALEISAQNAVNLLWSQALGLPGLGAYHFLHLVGAPVAIPGSAKRRFLYRLGWLHSHKADKDSFRAFQNVCEKAAHLSGETVQSLDFLINLLTADNVYNNKPFSICGKVPFCNDCVLSSYCEYFRHRGSQERRYKKEIAHIKEWLPEDRPREQMERLGPEKLTDTQLAAIILRTGTKDQSVLELANTLLHQFGSFRGLDNATIRELCQIPGVGKVKAIELKAAIEIGKRFLQDRAKPGDIIQKSEDVFTKYRLNFSNVKQETFFMLILSSRNQVMKQVEVSRGSLTSSTVHPREVFREAIRESASGVVFVHNHPSGDPTPSRTDILMTERLKSSGEILGIRVLDHIIIGEQSYYSFADQGLL